MDIEVDFLHVGAEPVVGSFGITWFGVAVLGICERVSPTLPDLNSERVVARGVVSPAHLHRITC